MLSGSDKSTKGSAKETPNPKRQSLFLSTSQRMLLRTIDHSEPPVEDPNNLPEVNVRRRQEYERLQKLNQTMETVLNNFKTINTRIQTFSETLDETEQLLDLWTYTLSQTQHTKRILEELPAQLGSKDDTKRSKEDTKRSSDDTKRSGNVKRGAGIGQGPATRTNAVASSSGSGNSKKRARMK
ncbi:hypothetical protein BC940DRAFT_294513 [Gongronella butleri]|nr:hypothetical protein BC940DRAFT_294513 [Gongronella butleri]